MPSHVHLVIRARDNKPGEVLDHVKSFTSKQLQKTIEKMFGEYAPPGWNAKPVALHWMLWMMERAGQKIAM